MIKNLIMEMANNKKIFLIIYELIIIFFISILPTNEKYILLNHNKTGNLNKI